MLPPVLRWWLAAVSAVSAPEHDDGRPAIWNVYYRCEPHGWQQTDSTLTRYTGPACEAGVSAGMRKGACATTKVKERKKDTLLGQIYTSNITTFGEFGACKPTFRKPRLWSLVWWYGHETPFSPWAIFTKSGAANRAWFCKNRSRGFVPQGKMFTKNSKSSRFWAA